MCGVSPLCLVCWHVSSCYQIQWGIGNAVMQGRCRNPIDLFGPISFLCWICFVSSLFCLMVPMVWLHIRMVRWISPMPIFLVWLSLVEGGWVWALSVEVVCPTYTWESQGPPLPISIGSVLWTCVFPVQQHSFDVRWEALVYIMPAVFWWWLSCIRHWLRCLKFVYPSCGPCW